MPSQKNPAALIKTASKGAFQQVDGSIYVSSLQDALQEKDQGQHIWITKPLTSLISLKSENFFKDLELLQLCKEYISITRVMREMQLSIHGYLCKGFLSPWIINSHLTTYKKNGGPKNSTIATSSFGHTTKIQRRSRRIKQTLNVHLFASVRYDMQNSKLLKLIIYKESHKMLCR